VAAALNLPFIDVADVDRPGDGVVGLGVVCGWPPAAGRSSGGGASTGRPAVAPLGRKAGC
jgi:hypothetical protein